jgi:hypothetical protein
MIEAINYIEKWANRELGRVNDIPSRVVLSPVLKPGDLDRPAEEIVSVRAVNRMVRGQILRIQSLVMNADQTGIHAATADGLAPEPAEMRELDQAVKNLKLRELLQRYDIMYCLER